MRWLLLVVSLLAFGGAFKVATPGLVAACLALGIVTLIGALMGFVAARVGSVARGQDSRELDVLIQAKKATSKVPPASTPRG